MHGDILSALNRIAVSELSRAEWIAVGMALKEEGFPVEVWDEWSRNDSRYHAGECGRLWKGFHGSGKPVTGGTIIKMARERGWDLKGEDGCLAWDDEICYDGAEVKMGTDGKPRLPTEELILYLETLFEPTDRVGYVTGDAFRGKDGKWMPGKGVYDRTAGELIAQLQKHPEDIGAAIGDWKKEAGAWIRFNPLDGKGVKNENVKAYRYALVESDQIPIEEQEAFYRRMELPMAALVYSGGKSMHAIVRVDAANEEEYRKRVDYLYGFLEKHGLPVDRQNRNPSRLSRMPGVTRKESRQRLIGVNIGRKNWEDWLDFSEGMSDDMPAMVALEDVWDHPPELPEEMIAGILRVGHKMLISGPSKAGKSFLLMELCAAIAEGTEWLGFKCRKGRVLYINLEIDPASAIHRFLKIYKAMGLERKHAEDLVIWNLRGHAAPLDQLVPKIVRRIREQHFDAVVLDPIYKIITGDENNASEMGYFCNQLDKICTETGCSAIYCHHHSKGAQGMKKAMDRASGSGVFARDPDAQLDIIELEMSEDILNNVRDGRATAWRLETSLREFPNITPVEFWFEYPIHRVDSGEYLKAMPAQGSFAAGKVKNKHCKTGEEANEDFRNAFDVLCMGKDSVPISDMAEYLDFENGTVYSRVKKLRKEFKIEKGNVIRLKALENKASEDVEGHE